MGCSPYRRGEPFNGKRQFSCLRILGVRRRSASKKPDKPDIAKQAATLPPLGATRAGWRGCGAIWRTRSQQNQCLTPLNPQASCSK
jgi:hypothetical protein